LLVAEICIIVRTKLSSLLLSVDIFSLSQPPFDDFTEDAEASDCSIQSPVPPFTTMAISRHIDELADQVEVMKRAFTQLTLQMGLLLPPLWMIFTLPPEGQQQNFAGQIGQCLRISLKNRF
jgi:hypothetical protein